MIYVGRINSKWKRKFRSLRDAERYIARLWNGRKRKAVEAGEYYIDAPEQR